MTDTAPDRTGHSADARADEAPPARSIAIGVALLALVVLFYVRHHRKARTGVLNRTL